MTNLHYPACIRELYESEIFGEAVSLALVEAAKNERDKYHFGTLLQLETETKARLRPFLRKYDLSLSEEMDLPDIEAIVAGYRAANWEDFMGGLVATVKPFLARFEEIASVGPTEDKDVLESMVRHEAAILKWLEIERSGGAESSLDDLIAQLQYPLPRPTSQAAAHQ